MLLLRLRRYFKSLAAILLSFNTSSQKQGSTAYTSNSLVGDEALAAATEEYRLEFLIHTHQNKSLLTISQNMGLNTLNVRIH